MFMRLILVLFVFALSACSSAPESQPAAPDAAAPAPAADETGFAGKWTVTGDIDTPESAYFDPGTGDVFVSLVGGAPEQKDGNGRIARIGADGTVKVPAWVTGLNAPKGLRSHNGMLWTSDIDEIVGIEISSATVLKKIKVMGATFLNDVAIGTDGTVYVTDMLGNKIYELKGDKVSVFAEGEDLE